MVWLRFVHWPRAAGITALSLVELESQRTQNLAAEQSPRGFFMSKNRKIFRGVCRDCYEPIDWRKTKNGRAYRAEPDSTQPHQCAARVKTYRQPPRKTSTSVPRPRPGDDRP